MEKLFQVFVSSTFSDLEDERRAVSNALAKAGYIVAGMELFPATDTNQLDYIQTVIDRSDFYVVIVGGRYGSIGPNGLSFTEHEYEYARSKGIPILGFLHGNPDQIPSGKTESDVSGREKLTAFKAKLQAGRLREAWTNKDDLCTKVVIAVGNEKTLKPRIGWVRGDQAIDPKVLQDLERLRIENAEMKERLASLEGNEVVFDPRFAGLDSIIDCEVTGHYFDQISPKSINFFVCISLQQIFVDLYDVLLNQPGEVGLTSAIGRVLVNYSDQNPEKAAFFVQSDLVKRLRNQFEALGLIETVSAIGNNASYYVAWRLTEKGKRYAFPLIAIGNGQAF